MADLNAIYEALLGRGVDPSGASTFGNMSEDAVRSAIMSSPEYASHQQQAKQMQQTAAVLPQALDAYGKQFGNDAYVAIPGINDYTAKMEAAQSLVDRGAFANVNDAFKTAFGMTPQQWQGVESSIASGNPMHATASGPAPAAVSAPATTQQTYSPQAVSAPATYASKPFNFEADPGYAFRKSEGEKAIQARQLASGNFFSGGAMKELTDFNSGLASQEYGNAFARYTGQDNTAYDRAWNENQRDYNRWTDDYNRQTNADNTNWSRLAYLDSSGQNAATQTANLGANAAGNIGNLINYGGTAQSNGYINGSNAWTNALGNALYAMRK